MKPLGRIVRKQKRGRPRKDFVAGLRAITQDDYDKLVNACIESILLSESIHYAYVWVKFPHIVKFPKGFPKGVLMEMTELYNIYRIKARYLLRWLYAQGHTKVTPAAVGGYQTRFTILTNKFEKDVDDYGIYGAGWEKDHESGSDEESSDDCRSGEEPVCP